MLKQDMLGYFYGAVQEQDPAKRNRMLISLEDDFSVYPPYWFYRAKATQALMTAIITPQYFLRGD